MNHKLLNNHACIVSIGETKPLYAVCGWEITGKKVNTEGYVSVYSASTKEECKIWCDIHGILVLSSDKLLHEVEYKYTV